MIKSVRFSKILFPLTFNQTRSDGVISHLLGAYISTEIDWKTLEVISQLGIDEISIRKGHRTYALTNQL